MFSNTKLLVSMSMLIILSGFALLWFGIQPQNPPLRPPMPSPSDAALESTASAAATFAREGERAIVSKVVDGDTIELENGQTVRLIGIDTPETVDPRRPVQCFGKEASNEAKKILQGREIILQKDVSETDKYKRLLRYVLLPLDGGQILFVNDYLIRQGFARVLTYPPDVKYNEQFREAERQARENERGLWKLCR